jgi:hypothetical protein
VQHAPIPLNPVGQLFIVPAAVKDHERSYSTTYNRAGLFLFHDFRKRAAAAMIFAVSLYPPIIFTKVPGRGDNSTPLNRGCILQFISSQDPESSSESCKSFPNLKLGYCPECVTATLAAERHPPGSDPSKSLIAARSIHHL